MNQRIQELADEAAKFSAIMALPTGEPGDKLFVKKFAELIVRECVSTLGCEIVYNDNYTEKNKIISDMMELLKQHFGVEE